MNPPKLSVVSRTGEEREFEGACGDSIMENIRDNGFDDLVGVCGGNCSCGTCHIYVDPGFADVCRRCRSSEDSMLAASDHRTAQSRLACQIPFAVELEGLRVRLAPEE